MGVGSDWRGELLGVAEVAEYLGVGTVTVYRWCREGRLPCLKVGRSWRIRREALEDFLSRGRGRRRSWGSCEVSCGCRTA